MSAKSSYISEACWKRMPTGLKMRLLAQCNKAQIVGRFACNVHSDLAARGEHLLGRELLAEIDAQIAEGVLEHA
jgi:hypothetical protein